MPLGRPAGRRGGFRMSDFGDAVTLTDVGGSLTGITLGGSPLNFAEEGVQRWSAPIAIGDRLTTVYVSVEASSSYDDPYIVVTLPIAGEPAQRPLGPFTTETLLTVNELNRDPGTKYRLVEGQAGDWSMLCEREIGTGSSGLSIPSDVQTAVDRLIDADAITKGVIDALGQSAPADPQTQGEATVRSHSRAGLCWVLILILLGGFAALAVYFSGHPEGSSTGPAAPKEASRALSVPVRAVAMSHGFVPSGDRAALDDKSPGGPIWVVYQFDKKGSVQRAIAIDGRTFKVVTSYKRLKDSGAYPSMNLEIGSSYWVTEGILLTLTLVLLPVWARRTWRRTLQLLFGEVGTLGAWVGRCVWGLCWIFAVYAAGELIEAAVRTGSPASKSSAALYTFSVVVVWTFAGVAVMREGAQETEALADALSASPQ